MIFCRQSQMIRALQHQLSPLGPKGSARTSSLLIDEPQKLIRRLDRVRRRDPAPPTIVLRLKHLYVLEVARLNLAVESGNRDNGLSERSAKNLFPDLIGLRVLLSWPYQLLDHCGRDTGDSLLSRSASPC